MLLRSTFLVLLISVCTIIAEDDAETLRVVASGETNRLIPLIKHGNKSYFIGTTFKASHLQAMRFCKHINMSLLSIESEYENAAVLKFIMDKNAGSNDVWSSGSKIMDGKAWLWLSTGKEIGYTNWDNNQPNSNVEYCLSLKTDSRKTLFWHDDYCQYEKNFVCKAEEGVQVDGNRVWSNIFKESSLIVSDDFTFENKNFYFSRQFKGTFWQSVQFCENIGMKPASVLSEAENNRLYKHLRDTNAETTWWTSGTRTADKVHWFWLSNGLKVNYTNWGATEPNNRASELCLSLMLNKDKGLFFNDIGCTATYPVICERPVDEKTRNRRDAETRWMSAAVKVKQSTRIFGKYYVETDFKATKQEASDMCHFYDMRLVDIRSEQETAEIVKELKTVAEEGPFWMSGKKSGKDWVWDTDNHKLTYTNWRISRPGISLRNNCMQVDTHGRWLDISCDKEAPFICKKGGDDPAPPPVEDCKQPVINVYINNNVAAQENQNFLPVRIDDQSSSEGQHSVLVNNRWDSCKK